MQVSAPKVRTAVENDQIVPVFQPIVSLETGLVSGFEVLTRWKHPRQGLILPTNFIELAEQQGLIDLLTDKILHTAFIVARAAAPDSMLSVNISPIQLRNRLLPGRVRALCRETRWPVEQLTIEITETAIIDNLDMASRVAADLKSMGCRLAVDDFGTGYSSLLHLQSLPFDELKVDREFVREMPHKRESRKIVGAVLDLARSLDLLTVAEGVENEEQCEMLFRLGCQFGQGWLYGKAMPAIQLPRFTQCPTLCNCATFRARDVEQEEHIELAVSTPAAQLKAVYDSGMDCVLEPTNP
ncbi:MAG TPA: EAL domain-containing protein [Terracidiphilus sp.]|jgi:EAL domain-containing protein (putative c-di-GMP-specific phosphodiesterase class I)